MCVPCGSTLPRPSEHLSPAWGSDPQRHTCGRCCRGCRPTKARSTGTWREAFSRSFKGRHRCGAATLAARIAPGRRRRRKHRLQAAAYRARESPGQRRGAPTKQRLPARAARASKRVQPPTAGKFWCDGSTGSTRKLGKAWCPSTTEPGMRANCGSGHKKFWSERKAGARKGSISNGAMCSSFEHVHFPLTSANFPLTFR